MLRTVIKLKEDTPNEVAKEIRQLCIKAHDNYVGKLNIKDISPRYFIFEGERKDFGILQLGWLALRDEPLFIQHVDKWLWRDENPRENCDILKEFSRPVYTVY